MAYEQWTEDEARSALEAWKRSGSGIVQFARSRGMSPQRLYRWRRKLDFDAAESLAPALLPIRVGSDHRKARRSDRAKARGYSTSWSERRDLPAMRMSRARWTRRSAMALAAAEFWKILPQSLKGKLVVMTVEARW